MAAAHVDVVVVGGGTSGLNAALQLARVGRSVVVLERRPEGASGARWVNGVLAWQYERAGLDAPVEPEVRPGAHGRTHMISPSRRHRFVLSHNPVIEADMRELVERLRVECEKAGVDLRWGTKDVVLEQHLGRPTAVRWHTDDGPGHLHADLFVDASGRRGVLRSQLRELDRWCPPNGDADLCSAQQLIFELDDADAALAWLASEGADPGDALVQVGMAGGFSTINTRVEPELGEVSVLTGSIPADPRGGASGHAMVKAVRAEHPWIGARVFGGGGLIPLGRTYDRFTAPGVALVGDAARMVMGGHGSGIGFGMIAGKVLAEAVDEAGAHDPGAAEVLWRYQATFLREFGAILAGYDAVRRMSTALGAEGVEAIFEAGIFSEALVIPGLDQRLGMLDARQATDAGQRLARNRAVAKVVVPALTAMTTARALYRTYPTSDGRAFDRWTAAARRLLPRQDW
ncbi:MAG: FAD-dependent oxidoreductase [Acidimicrobiales bacterium]